MPAQKIIIDTDPGVDDVLAILLALASPEIDVALVSIVFGNTHAPIARGNLLKIYHLLAKEIAAVPSAAARYGRLEKGKEKTVLALGADEPIGGQKAVAAYFHGKDGLSNITESHPEFNPDPTAPDEAHEHLDIVDRPSWQVMLSMLEREPERTMTIVALGPLTNLAMAYRTSPSTFSRVRSVVWMGGALEKPGNIAPFSEFNCYADPFAAAELLTAVERGEFEFVMAPLDITVPHLIPFADLIHPSFMGPIVDPYSETGAPLFSADDPATQTHASSSTLPNGHGKSAAGSSPPGPLRSFISAMLVRVRGLQASFGLPDAMEMHDPVAVWYALAHADPSRSAAASAEGWEAVQRRFQIERTGELTRGMCVVDRRGTGNEGQKRSEVEELMDGSVPAAGALGAANGAGKKGSTLAEEGRDRDGTALPKVSGLPWVVQRTPGKEELRRVLLSRVFGTEV